MSILYATLRQAVSIDAAFIMVPGHIFIAFDSGLSPEKGPRGIDSGKGSSSRPKAKLPHAELAERLVAGDKNTRS